MNHKSMSIRHQFLKRMLPALFFMSATFLALLAYFEMQFIADASRQKAQEKADIVALLLVDAVWQLSDTQVENILQASVKDEGIHCIRLGQESNLMETLDKGDCAIEDRNLEAFSSEIVYTYPDGETRKKLGVVTIQAPVSNGWGELSDQVYASIGLSVLLFLTVIIISNQAFKHTILAPLQRVSDSLKYYQQTGKRQEVSWGDDNELGHLISEYNQSLQLQYQYEQELKEAHDEAEQALESLAKAQKSLVHSEKMASLGSLVAGIAHEINTPLGNSLTIATTIDDVSKELLNAIESGAMKKSYLTSNLTTLSDSSKLLERNLHNAAEQVRKFKQVAVDQTSEHRRRFDFKKALDEILSTLKPQIKHTAYELKVSAPDSVMMDSYPGPLGQVVTNCFNNAIRHGFEGLEQGTLSIHAEVLDDCYLKLVIADNGHGMPDEHLKKAFDPFFTTKMGKGGSGLGLNLVYNLATTILEGEVSVRNTNPGLELTFKFPLSTKSNTINPENE